MNKLFYSMLCSTFLFTACSDDDNHVDNNTQNVPQVVLKAFQDKYQNVGEVKWDNIKNYHVARFNAPISRGSDDYTSSAWFTNDGRHCQSDQEIAFNQLPLLIKDAFNAYKMLTYPNWKIDDCEVVVREGMGLIYVIEIESGEQEREISISEFGDILKDVPDVDDDDWDDILPVIIPDEILDVIEDLFPKTFNQVTILELENNDNEIEVDILDGKVHKEIKLSRNYKWISTEYEVTITEALGLLSEEVADKLVEMATQANIDLKDPMVQKTIEVEVKETSKGRFFEVEIELGEIELDLIIDEDGNISIDK